MNNATEGARLSTDIDENIPSPDELALAVDDGHIPGVGWNASCVLDLKNIALAFQRGTLQRFHLEMSTLKALAP
tara:strand:+ start:262 stop:483 length:222 start_codon:yes stop_codon:yes gene_type:complete